MRYQPILLFGVLALGNGHDHAGEGEQGEKVGQDHEAVEHIGDVPHEVHLEAGAEHDEAEGDNGVELHELGAEQGLHVHFAEEVPADDGGEGEEEQADSDEQVAELAEHGAEGALGEGGAGQAAGPGAGDHDDEGGAGEHHEGVDEHGDHGHHALIVRMLDLGKGVGMGGRTHTGFVGEQAAGNTEAHGLLDGDAEGAAASGFGAEGHHEDGLEGFGNGGDVGKDDHKAAEHVQHSHDGHELFGHAGDALGTADEDEAAKHGHEDTGMDGVEAEGGLAGGADGVGLHHVAHEAAGKDDGNGEEHGQSLTEGALEGGADVVGRAAHGFAVFVGFLILKGEHGFGIVGGHAEEGAEPHPEDSAGAAGGDGGSRTGDVASAHLSGNGGGEGLEGAHAGLIGAFAMQGCVAEEALEGVAELANLDEAQAEGVENTGAAEEEEKEPAPQYVIDGIDKGSNEFHDKFL